MTVTAPTVLREQLEGQTTRKQVASAAKFRPGDEPDTVLAATKFAMKKLALRFRALDAEIKDLDRQLTRLVTATAPKLVARRGVGIHTTATLLVTAGDNPETAALRGSVRPTHRHRPDPCLIGTDQPVPSLPRRGPSGQLRTPPHRRQPPRLRPPLEGLRHQAHRRDQGRSRHPPTTQALHRPRALPAPRRGPQRRTRRSTQSGLTAIEASVMLFRSVRLVRSPLSRGLTSSPSQERASGLGRTTREQGGSQAMATHHLSGATR